MGEKEKGAKRGFKKRNTRARKGDRNNHPLIKITTGLNQVTLILLYVMKKSGERRRLRGGSREPGATSTIKDYQGDLGSKAN